MHKVIISGGGTGGHIFPAISIAQELLKRFPEIEILFVGANGKMEMQKVPEAGFTIVGLDIAGFKRKLAFDNLLLPFKLFKSLMQARSIIKSFRPDAVIGVGGFASGPLLWVAQMLGVPTLIQEQNGYAGVTNKILGNRAKVVCVAHENMERFFPKAKIVITGNPIRKQLLQTLPPKADALSLFNLNTLHPVLLIIGGSLGAKSINQAVEKHLSFLISKNIQIIWQTGSYYYEQYKSHHQKGVYIAPFISDMQMAYAASNVVVSRAGAGSLAEICYLKLPAILIPSPNVSEDHQTHNATMLVEKNAAIMVKDRNLMEHFPIEVERILFDQMLQTQLTRNLEPLAIGNADQLIVDELLKIGRKQWI